MISENRILDALYAQEITRDEAKQYLRLRDAMYFYPYDENDKVVKIGTNAMYILGKTNEPHGEYEINRKIFESEVDKNNMLLIETKGVYFLI